MATKTLAGTARVEEARLLSLESDKPSAEWTFDRVLAGDMVWQGNQLDPSTYTYTFNPEDIEEIEAGLAHFQGMSYHHLLLLLLY